SITLSFFLFTAPPTPDIYTLSLHDALPISPRHAAEHHERARDRARGAGRGALAARRRSVVHRYGPERREPAAVDEARAGKRDHRSEEHTSELQSPCNLVCRLLLEKKNRKGICQRCRNWRRGLRWPRGRAQKSARSIRSPSAVRTRG